MKKQRPFRQKKPNGISKTITKEEKLWPWRSGTQF